MQKSLHNRRTVRVFVLSVWRVRRKYARSTDLTLLARYHEHGDAFAFGELVSAHSGMVFATARRVTRDATLAEDVAAGDLPRTREEFDACCHGVSRGAADIAWPGARGATQCATKQRGAVTSLRLRTFRARSVKPTGRNWSPSSTRLLMQCRRAAWTAGRAFSGGAHAARHRRGPRCEPVHRITRAGSWN